MARTKAGPGRPAGVDAQETRDRILRAARACFAAHGYEGTSTRMIAERAGLATAALYHHFVRHDNVLTLISVVQDPVYLTEPFVRTTNWALDPHQLIAPYPCAAVVEIDRPQGIVPNHLPGTNKFLPEFAAKYGLPLEPTRGGAETMYPEYAAKVATMAPVPRKGK